MQYPIQDRLDTLNTAFSPSAPITSRELFRGRYRQIEETCEAINERGQHFVIYGERGVGKTSLANIINSQLQNVVVSKVTCNRDEDFKNIWKKALSKIRFVQQRQGFGFAAEKRNETLQLDFFLPQKDDIDSIDIQTVFENTLHHLCFVFDEFDSITSVRVKTKFADTIKALSDNAPNITIGIVGIATSIDDLIGHHPSLERCLKQIELPRMSKDELGQIIDKGLELLEISIDHTIREKIVEFSSGFPHFTHLLTKYCAQACIQSEEDQITNTHYRKALDSAIKNTNQSIRDAYQKATIASKAKSKFEDVIGACALALTDEFGTFATRDLVVPYHRITGKRIQAQSIAYNIQKLCDPERASILTKVGESKNVRYRFTNPLMRVYIAMKLDQQGTYQQPNLL